MPRKFGNLEERAGKAFVDRRNQVVLTIGQLKLTRRMINKRIDCGYSPAVARLNKVIRRHFSEYRTISSLANKVKCGDLMSIKHVGVTTIYVFMCVLKYAKINPDLWLDSEFTIATAYTHYKKEKRRKR